MSLQKSKTDAILGNRVHGYLLSIGMATPVVSEKLSAADEDKIRVIQKNVTEIMEVLGLDLSDDSLIDTPKRVAKMYVTEKFWGLKPENFPKCTVIENKMKYNEMVIENNIRVLSDCEHHLVQIDGFANVAYIPKNKVLGLSKLNRIVEYFSRRPQVQERLTQQIGEALKFILETDDVAVSVNARHYCVISRGVEDQGSFTVTNYLSGCFEQPEVRKEFFDSIHISR